VFAAKSAGITKVVLDYARETITISGKSLTLGDFAQGGTAVLVGVGVGTDPRSVRVRMAHKGAAMKH